MFIAKLFIKTFHAFEEHICFGRSMCFPDNEDLIVDYILDY